MNLFFGKKPTRRVNYNKEYTLQELKLFEDGVISNELKDFFETFKSRYQVFLNNEEKEKLMVTIYKSKELLIHKKQIILQGPPGTGKTREAKLIALEMLGLNEVNDLKDNEQFKLLQFHPSYTYEDFVRGIETQPVESGKGVVFKSKNKILAEFAELAHKNYLLSQENNEIVLLEDWINETFKEFKAEIEANIQNEELNLSGNIGIFKVETDCFKYGNDWKFPSRINDTDFKILIKAKINGDLSLDQNQIPKVFSVHAHYRFTYYLSLLRRFFETYNYTRTQNKIALKNYVLVIDEINRANLSSVLGELIYALEYRGEAVTSMYNVDNKDLILPPNLYIIGTMNTADRSVGHIDYAIRRRFAFVDVLPKDLSIDKELVFDLELFNEVAKLFETNLSPEFDKKEVQLGHSYFIQQYEKDKNGKDDKQKPINFELRLEYEIKPILLEYVKDGVLVGEDIKQKINDLTVSI